jgi:hypothetical protein
MENPALLAAVLEAPNAMSGIDTQTRDLIISAVIERQNPGALTLLERMEESIELVDVAAKIAFITAAKAAEIPDAAFNAFVEKSVGSTAVLDADINRTFADMANVV